jgi:hypothetical protein
VVPAATLGLDEATKEESDNLDTAAGVLLISNSVVSVTKEACRSGCNPSSGRAGIRKV